MKPKPEKRDHYHVFLASPGDVDPERHAVRKFFEDYNATTAHLFNAHFVVIDWHNHSSIGVGRPQELITRQTLEKHKDSLALVIGINAQRFGTPSGEADSGTEEEFNWALDQHEKTGWPEIKWFFRRIDQVVFPPEPEAMQDALNQWTKLQAFKSRIQNLEGHPILAGEYAEPEFQDRLEHDLTLWLNDSARPWAEALKQIGGGDIPPPPLNFDAERYRQALLKRYDQLNFEMLDTTGAYYSSVRLWSVFVPQSVREIHQYNPRLLEIPKEHQKRLLDSGELSEAELELAEQEAEALRMDYFNQPLRPVLDVVDEAQAESADPARRKLVLLGDPGAGKSALIRYLALRWAGAKDPRVRAQAPVPLLIELNAYARWRCEGRKDFIRFLEEAPIWHEWQPGQLTELTQQDSRAVLMLDGLDEIFEHPLREEVINDIQRFSDSHPQLPILVSSRVVGYQPQRLRDAGFRHFMLQDLDEDQINDFLDRWHKQAFDHPEQAEPKRARLAKAVAESQSIAMLAGNPLLLTMMA
ncbi:MAG: NACHT domain-containing protein, partial [Gammaproteobacteria bacterium]